MTKIAQSIAAGKYHYETNLNTFIESLTQHLRMDIIARKSIFHIKTLHSSAANLQYKNNCANYYQCLMTYKHNELSYGAMIISQYKLVHYYHSFLK